MSNKVITAGISNMFSSKIPYFETPNFILNRVFLSFNHRFTCSTNSPRQPS